jgi:hypothetical protein
MVKNVLGFMIKKIKKYNLIKTRNKEMDEIELNCKAFIEDYMNRVIDKS